MTNATGLSILSAAELLAADIAPRRDLLAPLLAEDSAALVYGPAGIGKSFFALGIAWAAASGARSTFFGVSGVHRIEASRSRVSRREISMARRERASSVTRAFRGPRMLRPLQSSQPQQRPQPLQRPEPLLLESLFDSAPESWIALLPRRSPSQHVPQDEIEFVDSALLHRVASIAGSFTSRA